MNIYIDESVHEKFGFMIMGYVICKNNPQTDVGNILSKYSIDEHHSCARMDESPVRRELRSDFISYLNTYCQWGCFIMPSELRHKSHDDISFLLSILVANLHTNSCSFYFDEGIINSTEARNFCSEKVSISICSSQKNHGIQLADLVASFCGIRFREAISGKAKILTYGSDCGYEPPIEAPLGFELFTTLRLSMLREHEPQGDEMPEFATFRTINKGLILSRNLSSNLNELAMETFGEVYLGCVH
ncbi:DUF3800 domain-containing protein [Serratia sp. JSRIV002]|uniref:DUF3800 domain-containing protein n=1 Tax=Serratia TaxID=613 RepID=UPI001C43BECF|nr:MULTISPECIES: DUF3800 domain-containing protein [Serratia]QXN60482.1 DUF3800 domain-containing protein [Serratia fonticola]UAN50351.1 DUF3800 domain-containing protein [Serratia sp. JSRIV002]